MGKGDGWKSLLLGCAAILVMLTPRAPGGWLWLPLAVNALSMAPGVLITLLVWIVHRLMTRRQPPATFLQRVNRLAILFVGIGILYGVIVLSLGDRVVALRALACYAAPAPVILVLGHAWHFTRRISERRR